MMLTRVRSMTIALLAAAVTITAKTTSATTTAQAPAAATATATATVHGSVLGQDPGGPLALKGRLIDGTGAPPLERGVVVIEGGKIRCSGSEQSCRIPRGARVVDAGAGTILPGLIDLHAHIWDPAMFSMFLPAGVTAVRDLHNAFEGLAVLDRVSAPSPRLFRAGPLIDGPQARSLSHATVSGSPSSKDRGCQSSSRVAFACEWTQRSPPVTCTFSRLMGKWSPVSREIPSSSAPVAQASGTGKRKRGGRLPARAQTRAAKSSTEACSPERM